MLIAGPPGQSDTKVVVMVIALMLSPSLFADPFPWNDLETKIDQQVLSTEVDKLILRVGSYCLPNGTCDVMLGYSRFDDTSAEITLLHREIANEPGLLSIKDNKVELLLVFYPFGGDDEERWLRRFEWHDDQRAFVQLKPHKF